MPKDRRVRSTLYRQSRTSSIPSSSKDTKHEECVYLVGPDEDVKEWEEVRCPICMEHPHSAVLLRCSSSSKGCRPYICNTSHRHSNCLSQFCTSADEQREASSSSKFRSQTKLVCPLCRGQISGWVVIEPARQFMNSKARSCPHEACDFSGTYVQLRNHTRREHPENRPLQVDPSRLQEWMRLQRQTEMRDALCVYLSQFQDITEDIPILRLDWFLNGFVVSESLPPDESPPEASPLRRSHSA